MSIDELVAKVEPLKAPIAGDSPVGADASYDPDFEALKTEIDKLAGMAGDTPNWSSVVDGATELLTEKTKDLRLLIWLAIAKMHQSGLKGLLEGMVGIREVSAAHWDAMFPPARRARARANLVTWFAEQGAAFLLAGTFGASDREPLTSAELQLSELDTFFREKLADSYTGVGVMQSAFREKVRELPPEKKAEPPKPAAAAAAPTPSAAPAGAAVATPDVPSIGGEADIAPALRAVAKTITGAADVLRKADPAKAWAYRLQRVGAWLAVREPPPAEDGKTRIRPPPEDQVKKLETLQSNEQWLPLLLACEAMTGQFLFWLDLHRLSSLAMDRLGALFVDARETAVKETLAFVQRFPSIADLAFADGTPFASAATQAWLDEQARALGGGGGGGSSRASEEDEELARRFEEVKELVGSGKVAEGLGLGIQLASRAADGRSRFRSRLLVAKLALQGNKPEVARPLFRALQEEGERHQLEVWEPALAAEIYGGLVAASKQDKVDPEVFEKLCQLDPATAIKVGR